MQLSQSLISLFQPSKPPIDIQSYYMLGFKSPKITHSGEASLNMKKKNIIQSSHQAQIGNRSIDLNNILQKRNQFAVVNPIQREDQQAKSTSTSNLNFKLQSVKKIDMFSQKKENFHEVSPLKLQTLNTKISQYLTLCNMKQIDHQNGKHQERLIKFIKKSHQGPITQTIRNSIRSPVSRIDSSKDTIQQIDSYFQHFNVKLPTKMFTLKHIHQSENSPSPVEVVSANKKMVENMIANKPQNDDFRKHRLKQSNATFDFSEATLSQVKQPDFTRYVMSQPMMNKDVTINFKQLVSSQKKKEKLQQFLNNARSQVDIIKKKNQIQIMTGGSKKVKQLQQISGEVINQIQQQNSRADQFVDKFSDHLQI